MNRQRRRILQLAPALLALSACERSAGPASRRIDADWHRKALVEGHLAHWLAASPTASGMFLTQLDRQWRPKDAASQQRVLLTMQARLVYAMAIGHELTQDARYLEAARRGASFLLASCRDALHGGFFYSVAADGKPIAEHKESYGQAFALLALATLARVDKAEAPRWQAAALRTWDEVQLGLRDPAGGLYIEASRNFSPSHTASRTQNPVMHMFEALLSLVEATSANPPGDDAARRARTGARALGDFVLNKLMQGLPDGSARIAEWYDGSWQAVPMREKGGYFDLGHQFEWVHLLLEGSRLGVSPVYASVAERLLQYALKLGYDDIDGGAYMKAFPDVDTVDREKSVWQQAEAVHALVAAAAATGRPELWRRYEQTLAFVRSQLVDEKNGGWNMALATVCRHGGCEDLQPDPYHMTSMHLAAIRAAVAI